MMQKEEKIPKSSKILLIRRTPKKKKKNESEKNVTPTTMIPTPTTNPIPIVSETQFQIMFKLFSSITQTIPRTPGLQK